MTDKTFYVLGGEYADSNFETIASGGCEHKYGPFTEQEAHDFWRDISSRTVDEALVRYVVKSEEAGAEYFVVGGEYADTNFYTIAKGATLEVYGPFNRPQALERWRELTARTVDSCSHRYNVQRTDPRLDSTTPPKRAGR